MRCLNTALFLVHILALLEKLEMLLGLDIYNVDLANVFEFPEGRIQQVDTIMDDDLVLEEDDDEDDGLLVDVMSPTENMDQIEEKDEFGDEIEGNFFFKQSSLLSIKRRYLALQEKDGTETTSRVSYVFEDPVAQLLIAQLPPS